LSQRIFNGSQIPDIVSDAVFLFHALLPGARLILGNIIRYQRWRPLKGRSVEQPQVSVLWSRLPQDRHLDAQLQAATTVLLGLGAVGEAHLNQPFGGVDMAEVVGLAVPPCPVLPFGIRGDLGDEGADLLVVASQAEEGAIEVGVVSALVVARQFAAKESRPHSIHVPSSVVVGQQDRGDGSITLCNDVYPLLITGVLNGEESFTGQRLDTHWTRSWSSISRIAGHMTEQQILRIVAREGEFAPGSVRNQYATQSKRVA